MAGLDPAIHAVPFRINLDKPTHAHRVDGRVKHGHDETSRMIYRDKNLAGQKWIKFGHDDFAARSC